MSAPAVTELEYALDVARDLARHGIPVFLARPDVDPATGQWRPGGGTGGCGYWLPKGWQHKRPDPGRPR